MRVHSVFVAALMVVTYLVIAIAASIVTAASVLFAGIMWLGFGVFSATYAVWLAILNPAHVAGLTAAERVWLRFQPKPVEEAATIPPTEVVEVPQAVATVIEPVKVEPVRVDVTVKQEPVCNIPVETIPTTRPRPRRRRFNAEPLSASAAAALAQATRR